MTRSLPESLRLPRSSRALLLAVACLGAAACSHDDGAASLEASVAVPRAQSRTEVVALAPDHASRRQPIVTLPPDAGALRDVRIHDYVDGLREDVALAGSAFAPVHNGITVLARTSAQPTLDERVPLARPTEAGIRSEIGAQFPHLAMQVVERNSANAYGSYGLALGRASGEVRCLYAWQWIDANQLPSRAGVAGPVSLRVRLCQAGTSFDAMAALIDHLAIGAEPDAQVAAVDPAMVVAPPEAPRKAVRRAHAARKHHRQASQLTRREETAPIAPVEAASLAHVETTTPSPTPFAADLPPQALLGPKAGTPKPY